MRQEQEPRQRDGSVPSATSSVGTTYAYELDVATDVLVLFANVLGVTEPRQCSRRQILETIDPEDRARFVAAWADVTAEDPTRDVIYRVMNPGGALQWVKNSGRAVFDRHGHLSKVVGVVTDITEYKLAEQRLRDYEQAVEGLEEMIVVVDREYRYLLANRKFLAMRQMTREQVVGRFAHEVLAPGVFENVIKDKLDACFRGQIVRYEMKYTYPEIGQRDVLISYFPIQGIHGIDQAACIFHDITERKLAETAWRESEERFRLMADQAPVMIWMSGTDKRPTYVNRAWLEFTGRSIETELGEGVAAITHPDDYAQCHSVYTAAFDARHPLRKESRLRRHDGEYRWILDVGVPRFVADGSFAGYIGTCTDITDHKRAQVALSNLNHQLIRAHEDERMRVARELHDDINQRLAILAIQLEGVKKALPVSLSEPTSQIDAAIRHVVELAEDVEALSHGLHCPKLELLGLVTAAKSLCRDFSEREQLAIVFESAHIPNDLSHDRSLCLYRVLQEALQNAHKHSGTLRVHVSLNGTSHDVELIVQDFGTGFLEKDAMEAGGMGLSSMQERLRLIGGQLSIQSTLQSGTTIHARVPFDA